MRQVLIGSGTYHLVDDNLDPLPVRSTLLSQNSYHVFWTVNQYASYTDAGGKLIIYNGSIDREKISAPPTGVISFSVNVLIVFQ